MSAIILYDGVCGFCNATVKFIIPRDPQAHFHFLALQSDQARSLLTENGLSPRLAEHPESLVLIQDGKVHLRSSAALQIARQLKAPWSLLRIFLCVPPLLRDGFYDWIARNRYRWFGRYDSCPLPPVEWRKRFLD